MKGVIYQIKTADGLYIGSTIDFNRRKIKHKNDLKLKPNKLLYKNIISNNGIYKIEIYCNVNCRDRRHLEFFEEQYRIILGANLNTQRAFRTPLEKIIQKKSYAVNKNRSIKYACECGGRYTRSNKSNHFKSNIHLKYIKDYQAPPL